MYVDVCVQLLCILLEHKIQHTQMLLACGYSADFQDSWYASRLTHRSLSGYYPACITYPSSLSLHNSICLRKLTPLHYHLLYMMVSLIVVGLVSPSSSFSDVPTEAFACGVWPNALSTTSLPTYFRWFKPKAPFQVECRLAYSFRITTVQECTKFLLSSSRDDYFT